MKPLISVVIPVYNSERYLNRCLDSILNQTLSDFEIILVDDYSSDKSRDICETYRAKDPRVKIICNEVNSGVSISRNKGLEKSTGKYITLVDSDDWLEIDALEYLYDLVKENNADIACYRMNTYKNGVNESSNSEEVISVYEGNKIIEEYIIKGEFLYSTCNKLYSEKIIRTIRFSEEIKYAEDALFNCYALSKCSRLVYSNLRKYNYDINDLSTVIKVTGKRLDILKAQKEMFYYLKTQNNNLEKHMSCNYIFSVNMLVCDIAKEKSIRSNYLILRKLKKVIQSDKSMYISLPSMDLRERFKFLIIRISPYILYWAYIIKFKFKIIL